AVQADLVELDLPDIEHVKLVDHRASTHLFCCNASLLENAASGYKPSPPSPIPVFMPQFTPHQETALNAVANWLNDGPGTRGTPLLFRLFGYAGTGKTTLARHLAAHIDGEVKFAAFTGKAALVMRAKGCGGASTIHSLIYRARESGEETPNFELWDDSPA